MIKKNVAFIGCGKLGLPCAEMMAEKHNVDGYDIVPFESETVRYVDNIPEVVKNKDLVFIAVPTPHDPMYDGREPTSHLPNKDFDYSIVKSVLTDLAPHVDDETLIVLISTVLPGTTRREFVPLLQGRRFIYNPYLIAMGTVKWDMVNPEMIMIGTEDGSLTGDAKELKEFYSTIMQNNPRVEIGTWDECECLKVFYNTFISAKISLVNMIQDVAEKQGNINSEWVCDALARSTRRIMGPSYMKPGLGDSGACHPRDNIALRYMAERLDLGYDLFDAIMYSREIQAKNMAKFLIETASQDNNNLPIVIVGKTYKPLVPYTDGSSSMLVGHYVEELGGQLLYHDYNTGDIVDPDLIGPAVYLLAHDPEVTYGNQLDHVRKFMDGRKASHADHAFEAVGGLDRIPVPGSILVDPWRKTTTDPDTGIKVIHYGNTRQTALR